MDYWTAWGAYSASPLGHHLLPLGVLFGLRGGQEHCQLRWNPSQITVVAVSGERKHLHNTPDETVDRMCSAAGISGYKTNHSLRVTLATRLFKESVDEQLIMVETGHRSTDGMRSHKRLSKEQLELIMDHLLHTSENNYHLFRRFGS